MSAASGRTTTLELLGPEIHVHLSAVEWRFASSAACVARQTYRPAPF